MSYTEYYKNYISTILKHYPANFVYFSCLVLQRHEGHRQGQNEQRHRHRMRTQCGIRCSSSSAATSAASAPALTSNFQQTRTVRSRKHLAVVTRDPECNTVRPTKTSLLFGLSVANGVNEDREIFIYLNSVFTATTC